MFNFKSIEKRYWDLERFGLTPRKLIARVQPSNGLRPIFMSSMPKSGTHLLERVLCLHPNIYRPLVPTLNPRNIEELGGWKKYVFGLAPGQLLVTHAHYDVELASALDERKISQFLMVRDPRAIVLSNAHYIKHRQKHRMHHSISGMTLSERIDFCIDEPVMAGGKTFAQTMLQFANWASAQRMMVIRFEDLVGKDTETTSRIVSNIFEHVGLNPKQKTLTDILAKIHSPISPTFRSGKTDEWRNVLTTEQDERIRRMLPSVFRSLDYV